MRTAYQFHNLSEKAKENAKRKNKGHLLTQYLYNIDGSKFENSTTIKAYNK